MKILFPCLLLVFLIACGASAFGCPLTETGVPACAYFTRADAVFSGKVLKIETASKSEELPEGARKVRFQILENFKGADNPTFTLVTTDAKADRGLSFKNGQIWLIYAGNDIVVKSFTVFRGVRVEPKVISDEAQMLKNIAAGKNEMALAGRFVSDPSNEKYLYEAVEITVEGKNFRQTAQTDGDGAFSISVPNTGKYKVALKFPYDAELKWTDNLLGTALTPGNPTFFKYTVELNQGDCNFSFFEVQKK